MYKRKKEAVDIADILVDIDGLCKILAVGRNKAREIAELAEARVDLSSKKIARYNVQKIKEYIDFKSF